MAQRSRHPHHDTPCGIIRELFTDGTSFAQECKSTHGQNRTRFRDRDSGSTSDHELLTEVALELRKGSAESGLGEAKLLRRAIDATQLGDPQKIFKLIQIHGNPL